MRHRGQQLPFDPERKQRTREHVIADLSYNFLERKVLQRGHWLDAPRNDYGIDATMFHHDSRGAIENGEVRFQIKATDKLQLVRGGQSVTQRVDARDVRYWCFESFPVVLVLYDAQKQRALWLHIQQYIEENPELMQSDAGTLTLRIPIGNKLNLRAVDRFRQLSLDSLRRLRRSMEDNI
jgi:hypothetical protein